MSAYSTQFFTALCRKFGWEPDAYRLAALEEWGRNEGMPESTHNLLATTRLSPSTPLNLSFDIGYGKGNWNNVPVRVYASMEAGVQATYETLALPYYPFIRKCLAEKKVYQEAVPEFKTYVGSEAYGVALLAKWQQVFTQPDNNLLTDQTRASYIAGIVAANGARKKDGTITFGDAAIKDQFMRGNSLSLGLALMQDQIAELFSALAAVGRDEVTFEELAELFAERAKK